jgi:hypothetical protein
VVSFAETLPRTESGTVRREAVRQHLQDGMAIPDAEGDGDTAVEESDEAAVATGPEAEPGGREQPDPTRVDPRTDETGAGEAEPGDRSDESDVGEVDGADDGADDDAFLIGREDWAVQDAPVTDVDRSDVDAGASGDPSPPDAGPDADDADLEQNPPDFVQEALAAGGSEDPALASTADDSDEDDDATAADDPDEEDDASTAEDPDEDGDPSAS